MAFALPVWLAVQEQLLGHGGSDDSDSPSCFDEFDDETLFQLFNLSRPCITFITDTVRIRMKKVALKKPGLSVDAMVMVTLNYYAHGLSAAVILRRLGLAQTDCPAIICMVSGVIAGMSDQFISFPLTQEARANVASSIEALSGIPGVLGILAPAHFKIRASPYEKDTFRSFVNSMGYTSVVSQIICDSDSNILSVEKCCVGSTCEQDLWDSSFKGREIEDELHGPYWVVGGRGYFLSKHVLTPVSDPANKKEQNFNEAHGKILYVMQSTLCSMKTRFKCLMQLGFAQEGSLAKKSNIIKACSVLHNIAKKFSVPLPPSQSKIEWINPGKQRSVAVEISPEALKARQDLIDGHFSDESSGQEDTQSNSITEETKQEADEASPE
ncbi:putative nuclease HARBI1 [Aulostomus maculatus]